MNTTNIAPHRTNDAIVRPKTFDQIVGQDLIKDYLRRAVIASRKRNQPLEHSLFLGSKGLGKTTLAIATARERGVKLKVLVGSDIDTVQDIFTAVEELGDNCIIFIDEIHLLDKKVQEELLVPMERFRYAKRDEYGDLIGNIPLKPFTIIGATTAVGMIKGALRDRFSYQAQLQSYTDAELTQIVLRSAQLLEGLTLSTKVAESIAKISRRNARVANNLLVATIKIADSCVPGALTAENITLDTVRRMCMLKSLDTMIGLDALSRAYLVALEAEGTPIGARQLAKMLGEDESTLSDAVEPFLITPIKLSVWVESGKTYRQTAILNMPFVKSTPRGRAITEAGREYLRMCRVGQVHAGWFPNERL